MARQGNRVGEYVVGAQRCGKSHYTNSKIKTYLKSGGSVLIYNQGKSTDFEDCEQGSLLDSQETLFFLKTKEEKKQWKESGKPFLFFEDRRGVHSIKDFNKLYKGKGLKVRRLGTLQEDMFFYAYYLYISNTLLVFDDAKEIFKPNLREWQVRLISKMNHTGSKHTLPAYDSSGSDLIIIFHSLNHISSQLLEYYNFDYMFTSFKYLEQPDFDEISNTDLKTHLIKSFNFLQNAPQYSRTHYFKGKEYSFTNK